MRRTQKRFLMTLLLEELQKLDPGKLILLQLNLLQATTQNAKVAYRRKVLT